jgi:hypothetical protein
MWHGCPLIRPSATFSLREKKQAEERRFRNSKASCSLRLTLQHSFTGHFDPVPLLLDCLTSLILFAITFNDKNLVCHRQGTARATVCRKATILMGDRGVIEVSE